MSALHVVRERDVIYTYQVKSRGTRRDGLLTFNRSISYLLHV